MIIRSDPYSFQNHGLVCSIHTKRRLGAHLNLRGDSFWYLWIRSGTIVLSAGATRLGHKQASMFCFLMFTLGRLFMYRQQSSFCPHDCFTIFIVSRVTPICPLLYSIFTLPPSVLTPTYVSVLQQQERRGCFLFLRHTSTFSGHYCWQDTWHKYIFSFWLLCLLFFTQRSIALSQRLN